MPDLTPTHWALAIAAAFALGVGKAGFAGLSIVHVLIFAFLFGARDSTGIVLPMLLVGDVCAVTAFHRHAQWKYVRRMLPPACVGVVAGALLMRGMSNASFRPVIGALILALAVLQVVRMFRPAWFGSVPHTYSFAWSMGLLAGVATMLANAAGPVFALYCMAVALPKFEVVGTLAWFFFIINAFKVPFSVGLGLIDLHTLALNAVLAPVVVAGVLGGRWLVNWLPQRTFELVLLVFAALAALRLILG
jgi:uncharacterized membrane protein YfcA